MEQGHLGMKHREKAGGMVDSVKVLERHSLELFIILYYKIWLLHTE